MNPVAPHPPAVAPSDARKNGYGHGHPSSVGHCHGIFTSQGASPRSSAEPAQRVTLVYVVDEQAQPPIALALRVHAEGHVLRPSLFPPRRGQRLPQGGLPSTGPQRLAMLRAHIDQHPAPTSKGPNFP